MDAAPTRRSRRKVKAAVYEDHELESPAKRARRSYDDAEPKPKPRRKSQKSRSRSKARRSKVQMPHVMQVSGSAKHILKNSINAVVRQAPTLSFPDLPIGSDARLSATDLGRGVSSLLRQFCSAEFCYASIDRGYFLRNEFEECLVEMNIPPVSKLCRTEWAAIRTVMGRPRRLSASFLLEERGKLDRYRRDVRLVQLGKAPQHSLADSPFVYQVPVPLSVGQHVTAIHPESRVLAMGCILTRDVARGIYRIQFDREQFGVHRVMDTDIMPHGPVPLLYPALASHSMTSSPVGFTPHDSWRIDLADVEIEPESEALPAAGGHKTSSLERTHQLRTMVQVQQLLDRKDALLQQLKTMNLEAKNMNGQYPESFRRGYTWLLMCLQATNLALDPVLQNMRKMRNLQGATSGPDVSAKLRMLLSRCDDKAVSIIRKHSAAPLDAVAAAPTQPQIEPGTQSSLIASALSLMLVIKSCSEHSLASWETWALLERGLNVLKPKFDANSAIFKQIESAVAELRSSWSQ